MVNGAHISATITISAFYWLLCVVGISTLATGMQAQHTTSTASNTSALTQIPVLVPIASSRIKLVLFCATASGLQEYARWVLCRAHRYTYNILVCEHAPLCHTPHPHHVQYSVMVQVIQQMTTSPVPRTPQLSQADRLCMYATHGIAQAAVMAMCLFARYALLMAILVMIIITAPHSTQPPQLASTAQWRCNLLPCIVHMHVMVCTCRYGIIRVH